MAPCFKAHNTLLNILWIGGVSLLFIFLILLYVSISDIKYLYTQQKIALLVIVFSVWIEMFFESTLEWRSTWIILYIVYAVCKMEKNRLEIQTI